MKLRTIRFLRDKGTGSRCLFNRSNASYAPLLSAKSRPLNSSNTRNSLQNPFDPQLPLPNSFSTHKSHTILSYNKKALSSTRSILPNQSIQNPKNHPPGKKQHQHPNTPPPTIPRILSSHQLIPPLRFRQIDSVPFNFLRPSLTRQRHFVRGSFVAGTVWAGLCWEGLDGGVAC